MGLECIVFDTLVIIFNFAQRRKQAKKVPSYGRQSNQNSDPGNLTPKFKEEARGRGFRLGSKSVQSQAALCPPGKPWHSPLIPFEIVSLLLTLRA